MPKKIKVDNIGDECRRMGKEDFYNDVPQTFIRDTEFFSPKSLAYLHWIEGWEQAAVEAYCEAEEMKQRCLIEHQRRYTQ